MSYIDEKIKEAERICKKLGYANFDEAIRKLNENRTEDTHFYINILFNARRLKQKENKLERFGR